MASESEGHNHDEKESYKKICSDVDSCIVTYRMLGK